MRTAARIARMGYFRFCSAILALAGCGAAGDESVGEIEQALTKTVGPGADYDAVNAQAFYCTIGSTRYDRGNCTVQPQPYWPQVTDYGNAREAATFIINVTNAAGEYRGKMLPFFSPGECVGSITIDKLTFQAHYATCPQPSLPVSFISTDAFGRAGTQFLWNAHGNASGLVSLSVAANPATGAAWTKEDLGCFQYVPPAMGWAWASIGASNGCFEIDAYRVVATYH
jgi:hypothetical protein